MNLRNVLKPGEYVHVVPVGIPCCLEYDDRGILQHLYIDYESNSDKLDDELKSILYQSKKIPGKISIVSGTSWVSGVLYTDNKLLGEGVVPDCIVSDGVSKIKSDSISINFFAGHVKSQARRFNSISDLSTWFSFNKFHELPGFVVPAVINDTVIKSILLNSNVTFAFELISEFWGLYSGELNRRRLNLHQMKVSCIDTYVDEYGNIRCKLTDASKSISIRCNISDVYSKEIHKQDYVMFDTDSSNLLRVVSTRKHSQYPNKITCKTCGAVIEIPVSGSIKCSDPHCPSLGYSDIHHFITRLGLPDISYDTYLLLIQENPDFKLSTIFQYHPYDESYIDCTLSDLLSAIVPTTVVSNPQVFKEFCTKHNNNVESVVYSISHPDRISYMFSNDSDIGTAKQISRFIVWIKDSYNLSTVVTLIRSEHIRIVESIQKYEGAPIFRNTTILITGKFMHGTESDIIAILSSYSAHVVTKFDDTVSCVVIGDFNEDTNGTYIRQAKLRRIPIFHESEFFNKYDIDTDIQQNLL